MSTQSPSIEKSLFGQTSSGQPVDLFTLHNAAGITARLSARGATLVSIEAPDRLGNAADVTLGFDTLAEYETGKNHYFGCTVGRYANRIAGGRFALDGQSYELAMNNDQDHLHGGLDGSLDKKVWDAEPFASLSDAGVTFRTFSPDGEENYPGNLHVQTVYTLTPEGAVRIEYQATADTPTILNLTNHAYFNLAGAGSPTIGDHVLKLYTNHYTPVGEGSLIPTGQIAPVEGTPLDFRQPTRIGDRIAQLDHASTSGYDHNFVINRQGVGEGELVTAAELHDPHSGRLLTVRTNQPGVQFYTGNFLDGQTGKQGKPYARRSACCLETQHFPDSPNQQSTEGWPSVVLRPGDTYQHTCEYVFSVR